ncbi:hypothetical protein [Cerasicoccus arenae]|uniref:Lipoprotein n=1 Tax=Cerasicoccus arenae TaxID=424488 RepID=A0A8J3DCX2_9BACT|nr:hypothetical protein [Cerasicoccus arenae]MBK1857580.1 hypothetical protein [Cerasicoccus arenae]GHC05783.1 hypothetical protein GCM10007047_23450 [Cerasicoccus arenae]
MNSIVSRNTVLVLIGLLGLALSGCHSAREFDYNGAKLDTVNAVSIDNRTPYPLERDTWRLGPTREAMVNGEEMVFGASEDGSTIIFKIPFYAFGKKSQLIKQSTERSTKALTAISKDLQKDGFIITKRIAIVDSANVIGYKIGGPARITGFYIFSQPGAYDALLATLDAQAAPAAPAEATEPKATEVEPITETSADESQHSEHEIEE